MKHRFKQRFAPGARLRITAAIASGSLLVGGSIGLVTKATMASQSLRISLASARIFSVS